MKHVFNAGFETEFGFAEINLVQLVFNWKNIKWDRLRYLISHHGGDLRVHAGLSQLMAGAALLDSIRLQGKYEEKLLSSYSTKGPASSDPFDFFEEIGLKTNPVPALLCSKQWYDFHDHPSQQTFKAIEELLVQEQEIICSLDADSTDKKIILGFEGEVICKWMEMRERYVNEQLNEIRQHITKLRV
jgi:hypothetical protein